MNFELPSSSYIKFNITRLSSPSLLWMQSGESSKRILSDCGWCQPLDGESSDAYTNEKEVALAERYGAAGVGVNGGGVRCGVFRGQLLKGIGRTVLAGDGAANEHSYGGASANAAIREAIWGEVFNTALPYKAVTAKAVLLTGTLLASHSLQNSYSLRAITVRPLFVRPAHFMRATFFKPDNKFKRDYVSDAQRTSSALHQLICNLGTAEIGVSQLTEHRKDVIANIAKIFDRFAVQVAAARAKRLVHSSLSPSNIALDGRFADFGGASAISDHGKIIIAPKCPDSSNEHIILLRSVDELLFYVQKYIGCLEDWQEAAKFIRATFLETLDKRYSLELLKLSGVSEGKLLKLKQTEIAALSKVFKDIINGNRFMPFKYSGLNTGNAPIMPDRMGILHLGSCITESVEDTHPEAMDSRLVNEIPSATLRSRFVETMQKLLSQSTLSLEAEAVQANLNFCRMNALRLNMPMPQLYFHNLRPAIDSAMRFPGQIQAFVDSITARFGALVKDTNDDGVIWPISDSVILNGRARTGVCLERECPADWTTVRRHIEVARRQAMADG